MGAPLGELSPEQFLAEYWQKKPCLIRQAIADFKPLLDGDDLAGLACEDMVESRLITGSVEAADWEVRNGPFTDADFATLPEQNWTLLVQDVEKHYAPLQALMQQFSFIPYWRLDDLMVSFAASGGSVGPHVDQYDVFLLQAEGTRRWQIASSFDANLLEDCALNVLQSFTAEQEWVLEAGDMLYLPPNVAHHGVALEAGMTFSIGSRAPSGADLLQGFGEWLSFADDGGGRYADPDLKTGNRAGEINPVALQQLRKLMLNSIDDNVTVDDYLVSFMSRFRLAHEPMPQPDLISPEDLLKSITAGSELFRNPWTRIIWIEVSDGARLLAAGQAYDCDVWLAEALCEWEQPRVTADKLDRTSLGMLTKLINNGHFLLVAPG
jgi:50S ribosomal protein L16 3-hydroxylase